MLVQSTLRSRLPGVLITGESRLPCVFITGELRLPGVFTTGELRLPSVFITGESFGHRGVILLILRSIQQPLKGMSFLKLSVVYFNSLGTCDLCLQKLHNLKDSYWLLGVFVAGESISNTNNSTNIQKYSKSFLGMPIGTRKSCLLKKTGHKKISWHCSFKYTNLLKLGLSWEILEGGGGYFPVNQHSNYHTERSD
jgi:hypothetical protein